MLITPAAQEHLAQLLEKQEDSGVGVRIFVDSPGTPMAETCIAYCRPGEQAEEDELLECQGFDAWIDHQSALFLEDAEVDYASDQLGGQLTIKAPNARVPKLSENSTLEERVNYILHSEINPSLAAHGGQVSLVELDADIAVLQFGGGCQGCGMVDVTLKDGVEKTLMEQLPELKGVRDVTDHRDQTNAYYR